MRASNLANFRPGNKSCACFRANDTLLKIKKNKNKNTFDKLIITIITIIIIIIIINIVGGYKFKFPQFDSHEVIFYLILSREKKTNNKV